MNEKMLRQTNERTYNGNLHDDAMSLGVGLTKLEKGRGRLRLEIAPPPPPKSPRGRPATINSN